MIDGLKALLKQPYWIIALVLGVGLVVLPCVTFDKNHELITHSPTTFLLVFVGMALLVLSATAFGFTLWSNRNSAPSQFGTGLDLSRVKNEGGVSSTTVGACEIRVVSGRIEEFAAEGAAVVLPCNEYFDDRCVEDPKSALGAYASRVFDGQQAELISLIKQECKRKFGEGTEQQKTKDERARSFGAGRCVLITNPLGRSAPLALVSTTTQRAGQGLASRISYLFDGMQQLVACLADARVNLVIMPVLGAGHGGIDASLAFVGLVLAIAEAARYGQGGQRLKKATIVVFKPDQDALAEVNEVVVLRALALVASQG